MVIFYTCYLSQLVLDAMRAHSISNFIRKKKLMVDDLLDFYCK